jgi:hypothetical protein
VESGYPSANSFLVAWFAFKDNNEFGKGMNGSPNGKIRFFLQFVVVTVPHEPTAASAPTGIGFRSFGLRWFFFSQDNNEFGKGTNGSPNGKIRFFLQFVVVTVPYEPTAASAPTGIGFYSGIASRPERARLWIAHACDRSPAIPLATYPLVTLLHPLSPNGLGSLVHTRTGRACFFRSMK